jgi:hypothetical protein
MWNKSENSTSVGKQSRRQEGSMENQRICAASVLIPFLPPVSYLMFGFDRAGETRHFIQAGSSASPGPDRSGKWRNPRE